MKKYVQLIVLFSILVVCFCGVIMNQQKVVHLKAEEGTFHISINIYNSTEKIYPWYEAKEDLYYIFLPSCVKEDIIYIDNDIEINGLQARKRFAWVQDEVYNIKINNTLYRSIFMKSANIPAFFIETESGSMDYLHESKEHAESGKLAIIGTDGHVQYSGGLVKIAGRGNSTWIQNKKPYSIVLKDKHPLCGLNAGKEWKLLSLYFEHDKIHSKIIFDLGRGMGIENTPECTWVDLYCHGEYKGLYLLTEDIAKKMVGEGAYLIEKTIPQQLRSDESAFSTKQTGFLFRFASPRHPEDEQVEEVSNMVLALEELLLKGEAQNHIDMESLAKQFLIDKIVMEADAMQMSTFFYIKGNKLSAGPLWDYDRAMGEILSDYTASIEDLPNGMYGWYMSLYENEEFKNIMIKSYKDSLPYFYEILNKGIDEYAEIISASVKMDSVLMKSIAKFNETTSYQEYENYLKYLKFFLANRLNYLGELWEVAGVNFDIPESTGEWHKVTLMSSDGALVDTMYIQDGEYIENVPVLDENKYIGWFIRGADGYDGKIFHRLIPVYEDMVLRARESP